MFPYLILLAPDSLSYLVVSCYVNNGCVKQMSTHTPHNLAAPPRKVPLPLRGQVLFGGFLSQFGWLWFGFSMIFVWAFGSLTSISGLYFTLGSPEIASGVISAVEDTNASENDTTVYANHYTFRVEQLEAEYQGVSYTTGQRFSVGETIEIEYLDGNPDVSRIQGTRSGVFDPWVLLVVGIFPLIGLIFIVLSLILGFKANYLLAYGNVGLGILRTKEPTNTTVNGQRVYKLTFEFFADDGIVYEATAISHASNLLEDEFEEQLLYHPTKPSYAVLVDNLPGSPDIDEFGDIQVANLGRSFRSLILPAFVLIGNGLAFLFIML